MLSAVLAAAVAFRWPWYILGLFRYTASSFFPDDFTIVYQSAAYVSILFQQQMFGWIGPSLVVLSVMGAVLSLCRREGPGMSAAAWTLLAIVGSLLGLGAILPKTRWLLPPPIYAEVAVWPFYAMFAGIALVNAARFIGAACPSWARPRSAWIGPAWLFPLSAAIAVVGVASLGPPRAMGFPFPPRSTPIVETLRQNIGLGSNAEFRGRVASLLPVDPKGADPWAQQFAQAYRFATTVGDDYQSIGLWYYQIPTLFEYNQFTSPGFHALIKRTLQVHYLPHVRNITVISTPDSQVLRLLGVRYVIMPVSSNPPGEVRQVETIAGKSWQLVELAEPNLASYSPTTVLVRHDLKSALDVVADDKVDLSRTVAAYGDLAGPLVRAGSTSLSLTDGDLHLTAASDGRSLIVVPIEYSACLEVRPLRQGGSPAGVSLHRVQGILTGIEFERELDVILAFRTGPFHNVLCRLQDYRDLAALLPP